MTSHFIDKRLMITGGGGFLGSHVVGRLRATGVQHIFAPRQAEFDFCDRSQINRALREFEPNIVIHAAAAVGGIGANTANPGRYFYENAVMGIELMELSRQAGVEKFVTIGTICAYPEWTPVPFREESLWDGYPTPATAQYGLAKKMLLVQGQAYRMQYDFNAIYLLPTNLYGPGDKFDLVSGHVIPSLIRKFVEAKEQQLPSVEVWGTGCASREFLFVEDAAEAIALATEQYEAPDPINLGTGIETTISELVQLIAELTGFEGEIRWDASRPDGQPRRCLDVSRAAEYFGFRARTELRDGLTRTLKWYEAPERS